MGKESRRKYATAQATQEMRTGVAWASELIRHPGMVATALSNRRLGPERAANDDPDGMLQVFAALEAARDAKKPADLSPPAWATSFLPALANARFVGLLQALAAKGHAVFWESKDPGAALLSATGKIVGDAAQQAALERAFRKLAADQQSPGWTALSLFSMARMVAVNANRSYDSNEWSEASLFWFDLDTKLFEGAGPATAKLLLKLDRDILDGELVELVGPRMLHALAEAAYLTQEAALFA